MKEPLYVCPVPMDLAWKDPAENLRRAEESVSRLLRAAKVPAEQALFVLPELTLTGFVTKDPEAYPAEPAHPHVAAARELARRLGTGLVLGFPELNPADPARPFNTLALIGPDGRVACRYRKMHLFTAGKNSEAATYTAGDRGLTCVYRGWKLGFSVCFDVRFPPLYMRYAQAGADLILLSACWIGGPHKTYQFKTMSSAYAVLTQAYVCAVNRSGKDPFYEYDGSGYVFSPWGEDVFEGKPVALDASEIEKYRSLIQARLSDREDVRVDSA
jgi:predicted amidohydrolase